MMDSDGIKERFMSNMWLLFSEGLATEALYNICTRPTMGLFRKAFLDLLLPDAEEGFDDYSVRINTDHSGTVVSLEIQAEKQVIFIEPKFFGSAQELIADRTAVLKKQYPLLERRILCFLTVMDRQAEIEEANKLNVGAKYPVEVRFLRWAEILGIFAKLRRESERLTKDKNAAIEPSQICRSVSVTRRRRTKS